jgi:hypothetical protein
LGSLASPFVSSLPLAAPVQHVVEGLVGILSELNLDLDELLGTEAHKENQTTRRKQIHRWARWPNRWCNNTLMIIIIALPLKHLF